MTIRRFTIVLTAINVLLLMSVPLRIGMATPNEVAPVLRGRALEIVDERGKVRASITVFPANPTVKMPDGTTGYPETVLLRLHDSKGRPNVKLAAKEGGAALLLGGESDPTYVQIL